MSKFTKCEKCGGNHFTIDCSSDDIKMKYVRAGQLALLEAIIDLFVNQPEEVGASEDQHYHQYQIKDMLTDIKEHLHELDPDVERILQKGGLFTNGLEEKLS